MRFVKAILIALIMLFTVSGCASAATNFQDTEHWAKDSIDYVTENGLFQGVSSGTFEPDTDITRGMFITVISRHSKEDISKYSTTPFTDIVSYQYYSQPAIWGYSKRIVLGDGSGCFNPNDKISRQDAAVMLYRYLGNEPDSIAVAFDDSNKIKPYAAEAIAYLVEKNILKGYSDNTFRPESYLTRAETAVLFARIDGNFFDNYVVPVKQDEKGKLLGSFKSTFYCSGSCCNGGWAGQTALGVKPVVGRTIAVDSRYIRLGSWVYVEYSDSRLSQYNGKYRAEDTGGAIKGYRIDMLLGSHSACNRAGIGYCNIYEVNE